MWWLPLVRARAGFTFIELIIVTSIVVLIFGAIVVSFQFTLELNYTTRVKLSALSLANDRMELFRSLPYDDVGVLSGFPAGTIPQNSTFSLNGFTIEERVRVDYKDDPADGTGNLGTGGTDANDIIQDYKQIKTEYEWTVNGKTDRLSLVSNIVPRSIETSVGAGTIRINVLDADNTLLPGASVRILSSSSTFSYDVTVPSSADGTALFSVPADSDYQAFVTANISGNQYSTSSTYVATTSNPNPVVAPFAVGEGGISTLTFTIGELSDLNIRILGSIIEGSYYETFTDASGIASSSNATSSSGQLVLADTAGVYESVGVAYLDTIAPSPLVSWEAVRIHETSPTGTDFLVRFYTLASTTYTLIPDTELPGNSAGFSDTLIDVSELDIGLYPTTTVGITLSTSNTSITPEIHEIEVYWREAESVRVTEAIDVQGVKTIGTLSTSTPIYKTTIGTTTDTSGEVTLHDLEFDTYTVTPVASLALRTACPAHPVTHQAGVDGQVELVYNLSVGTALRVAVVDGSGRAIPGATARLERSGYDVSQTTNSCGQTYFVGGGLSDNTDFELTVSAPGYTPETVDPFVISGETEVVMTINNS